MTFQTGIAKVNQTNIIMEDFRQFKIWEISRLLIIEVYSITKNLPDDGNPQFRNQIRRFSVLIFGNIVRSLQEKHPDLRCQYIRNAESHADELNRILQTAYESGCMQKAIHQKLLEELIRIRESLKAIQDQPDI